MPFDLPPLASRWKRLGGYLIDVFILTCAVLPILWPLVGDEDLADEAELSMAFDLTIFVTIHAIWLILNGYLLNKHGQTIGKRIVGTRIVDYKTNKLVPLHKIFFLRYLAILLFCEIPRLGMFIGLASVLFIFKEEKRCFHDIVAGTKVVDARFVAYNNFEQEEESLIVNYEDDTQ
jgi:uncharacterized RDD family membrane protein YckC